MTPGALTPAVAQPLCAGSGSVSPWVHAPWLLGSGRIYGRHAIVWQQFFVPAFGGLQEAGAGHCHSQEGQAQGSGSGSAERFGHCAGTERSGPKRLGPGGRWHITG